MIEIILLDRQRQEVVKLKVEAKRVAEASCLVYGGKYYIFGGIEGRVFTTVKFEECNPPVDISDAVVA